MSSPLSSGKIIRWICASLAQISSSSARDSVKPLAGSLLLCLAEFAVRCGPAYLMAEKDGEQTLLLMIFRVSFPCAFRRLNNFVFGLGKNCGIEKRF